MNVYIWYLSSMLVIPAIDEDDARKQAYQWIHEHSSNWYTDTKTLFQADPIVYESTHTTLLFRTGVAEIYYNIGG